MESWITYKTELSEILNNEDVYEIVNPLMTSVKSSCSNRQGIIATHMQSGGLSKDIIIDGDTTFFSYASQASYSYTDVIDQVTSLTGTTMALTYEKEISELQTLRTKLFERNYEVQRNIATLNSNYENREKGTEAQENVEYDNYYGVNGHVTLAKQELAENERKIYEVNVRLSKVNGGSKAYTSASETEKQQINIQNAKGASDDEWGELPSLRDDVNNVRVYRYTTPDGVIIEKTVKDGKVAYYSVNDNNTSYFFDNSGKIISRETVSGINQASMFTNRPNNWTNSGGNYTYNNSKDGCTTVVATGGSDGKPLYYVVSDGNETIYYNTNYERLEPGQVEKIVSANNLTPVTVPTGTSTTLPPEPSEDYIYGEHGSPSNDTNSGGEHQSSGGGTHGGGGRTLDSTEPPTEPAGEPVTEAPTEPTTEPAPPEDYVYGEHGAPSSTEPTTPSTESTVPSGDKAEIPTEQEKHIGVLENDDFGKAL